LRKAQVALGAVIRMEGADGPVAEGTGTLGRIAAAHERSDEEFLNAESQQVRLTPRR
jgi:hypothetical protein